MKKIYIIIALLLGVMFNARAQSILKLQDPTNQFIIDKAIDIDTPSGVYFVNVTTDSWVKTAKFVKQ